MTRTNDELEVGLMAKSVINFCVISNIHTKSNKLKITDCVNWCADIGPEFRDDRPLDEARIRTLAFNSVQLQDLIDSNIKFVNELADVGCITWSQRKHIVDTVHERDRNNKLLEFISRRSVAHFNEFIRILSKEQKHLVSSLLTDGGETSISLSE